METGWFFTHFGQAYPKPLSVIRLTNPPTSEWLVGTSFILLDKNKKKHKLNPKLLLWLAEKLPHFQQTMFCICVVSLPRSNHGIFCDQGSLGISETPPPSIPPTPPLSLESRSAFFGPLWGVPLDSHKGTAGFDIKSPIKILSLTTMAAFTVAFEHLPSRLTCIRLFLGLSVALITSPKLEKDTIVEVSWEKKLQKNLSSEKMASVVILKKDVAVVKWLT